MSREAPEPAGLGHRLGRLLGEVAAFAHRRPIHVWLAGALVLGLAALAISGLRVDPDVTRLLPEDAPSVRRLEALREEFGGVGYVVVLASGSDPETRRAFADALAPRLEALETVRGADTRRPVEDFEARALYYLELEELEALEGRLDARRRYAIERSFLDLDDEPPPPLGLEALRDRLRERLSELGAEPPESTASAYYEDLERGTLGIFARPTELASDLDFARRVTADVREAAEETRRDPRFGEIEVALAGRYQKRVELQEVLGADLLLTSSVALTLVVLLLAFHFRRVRAVVLVTLPLLAGLALTYALAALVFDSLNILTAFLGAILLGVGIDGGIHLLGRFDEERAAGRGAEAAIRVAFAETGVTAFAAALTTAAAFAALTISDFRAFRELGSLAAAGMILVTLAYTLLLPASVALFARVGRESKRPPERTLPGVRWLVRLAPPLFWLGATASFFGVLSAPDVRFDPDVGRLDFVPTPAFERDPEVNTLLGRSQTPLVVLAATTEEAHEVAALVRRRMREAGDEATIGLVASLADLIPGQQAEKRAVLDAIDLQLRRIPESELDEDARANLDRIERMVDAPPFGREDLPPGLARLLTPQGGGDAYLVLLFPVVSMGDAVALERLRDQVGELPLENGRTLAAAGEGLVLADIIRLVREDGPRVLAVATVFVFLCLALTLGGPRPAALALAPAALALGLTAGGAALLGIELNPLNVVVFPILLGLGVDHGAHIVARVERGEPLESVLGHTGRDVSGALLTDAFGFGALALAAHAGLESLGQLALLGLGATALSCLVILPAALGTLPLAGPSRGGLTLAAAIAKVLGAGDSPKGPGTIGALAALPIAYLIEGLPLVARLGVAVLVTLVGTWATMRYMRTRPGNKDPQEVVIDETAGCLFALVFVPFSLGWVIAAFVLFRALDMLKPGPVGLAERRLPGAYGVMGDDVVAGLLAGGLLAGAHAIIGL